MPASAPARLAPSLLRPGPDMRLAPALAFALAPFAASAIIFNVNGSNADVLVGASNCKTLQLLANWDLQTQPFSSDSVRLLGVRNAASCTSNPPSPTAEITRNETVAQTGNDTISANQLALADGGTSGCDDPAIVGASSANPATNLLCLQWISGGTLTQASVNVKYALANPTPPAGVSIAAGDRHLRLSWSPGNAAETIATYEIHVVPEGTTSDGGVTETVTVTNADVDHTDNGSAMQNDAGYAVTVVARDTYGTVSAPSTPVVGVSVYSADIDAHYRDEGGSALGGHGCATGSAPAWIAAVAIALALLLRLCRRPPNGADRIALV